MIIRVMIRIWYWLLGLFTFFLGAPYLGLVMMDKIATAIGDCSFVGYGCMAYGFDLSGRFEPYGIMFVNLLLTPVVFLVAFWDILIAWGVILAMLKALEKRQ